MDMDRQDHSMSVLRSLVAITRRGLADARDEETPLLMTEQSIMMAIAEQPGIRSTDIARMFRLNRSTVSRQLAALIRLGLVRETPNDTGRGRPLELTEDGADAFHRALTSLQRIVEAHLAPWSDDEVARFAHDLERFDRTADPS
ncbi:MarR family winged helix-turn-helix transcriptional regulator [Microbacterium galbinum]|uniref:MarR family winged helix-turn-helix transcriptional regulator n=1 Tax=Microbacterium galbinum TaxID=2851646 RepID=UPI001FFD7076|nr:MarR family transcriptional regulator [Microbacterium galbinum]MCK2028739.1 MarR family transcriptional regulator [Microbacterium galbinum]